MSTRQESKQALADRVLDAAAALLARHGIRKTSVEDIARAARCSRAAVYKHFPSKDAIVAALLTREVGRYLTALADATASRTDRKLLEDAFVFGVRYVREHPVVQGILTAEPEAALDFLERAMGQAGEAAVEATANLVRVLVGRGAIRRVDPKVAAEALLRLLFSFVLIPNLTPQDEERAMRRVFREAILRGLAPSE